MIGRVRRDTDGLAQFGADAGTAVLRVLGGAAMYAAVGPLEGTFVFLALSVLFGQTFLAGLTALGLIASGGAVGYGIGILPAAITGAVVGLLFEHVGPLKLQACAVLTAMLSTAAVLASTEAGLGESGIGLASLVVGVASIAAMILTGGVARSAQRRRTHNAAMAARRARRAQGG